MPRHRAMAAAPWPVAQRRSLRAVVVFVVLLPCGTSSCCRPQSLLDALNAIGTLSDSIMVRMDVFVAFIAALTLAAAALALVFRRASMRAEARDIQDLRERVARLEAGR